MELAHLKHLTRVALIRARRQLVVKGNFDPFAQLLYKDSVRDLPIPGQIMGNDHAKGVLFKALGSMCRETQADGMILVSDVWTLDMTPEQNKRFFEDPEYRKQFQKLSVPAAAAEGFGSLVEAIAAIVQTPHVTFGLQQMYERVRPDGVIPPTAVHGSGGGLPPHSIRLRGQPTPIEGGVASGRMSTVFEGAKTMEDAFKA